MNKQIIRHIAGNVIISATARMLERIGWAVSRVWSNLRFRALLPNSGQSACHWTVEVKFPENITVGAHVSIGRYSCLGAKSPIVIEDYVRISRGVQIETAGLDMTSG